MTAAVLLLLLAAGGPGGPAGTFVEVKPPPPPEPPVGFIIELKMGTFIPRVGDEAGLAYNPYETVFGNKSMLYGGGEFDFIPWHRYGAMTVGFAAGYSEIYGPALLQSNGAPSTEKTALILFPLRFPVGYRFDVTWSKWGIPFVPYVKLALLADFWRATKGGTTEVVNGRIGQRPQVGLGRHRRRGLHPRRALPADGEGHGHGHRHPPHLHLRRVQPRPDHRLREERPRPLVPLLHLRAGLRVLACR